MPLAPTLAADGWYAHACVGMAWTSTIDHGHTSVAMRHFRHAGGSSAQLLDDVTVFIDSDSDAILNAADQQQALLTSEERVDRAIGQMTSGNWSNDEQRTWLDRIRSHLIENLSIDHGDFDDLPLFSREGGWRRANTVFRGELVELTQRMNQAVAA